MSVLMATTTREFSVRPCTRLVLDDGEDAGPFLDKILDALRRDDRALGVGGLSYDYETQRIDTTFQVAIDLYSHLEEAVAIARDIFDAALAWAGLESHTLAVAAVEGDDPDELP